MKNMPTSTTPPLHRNDVWLWSMILIVVMGLVLALLVSRVQQVQILFAEASGKPANLIIPVQFSTGQTNPDVWRGISQGLEGDENMLQNAISAGQELDLQIVRIDHVFDQYDLVSIQDGQLEFDFTRLDVFVQSILDMGARPMFALSYTPPVFTSSGDVTGQPQNWQQWEDMVQTFIEHYSGAQGLNLVGVYYEVWNEPDLFGNWQIYREPQNYLTLYQHTAQAASRVQNAQIFFLGGPGTTAMYPNWMRSLLQAVDKQDLQLDFLSWHKYSSNVNDYQDEVTWVTGWLAGQGRDFPLIISEWGFDSGLNSAHDNNISAAHLIAVHAQLAGQVDQLMHFELIDSLDPSGREFWGRWGILTNSGTRKPRFQALQFLNELAGNQTLVMGQGSWVRAMSSYDGSTLRVIITNYDPFNRHIEAVPMEIIGLPAGEYQWTRTTLNGAQTSGIENLTAETWSQTILMQPNEVVLLEVTQL